MSERFIIEALQKAVTTAVGILPASLPVKYINVDFTIPTDDKWWEIVYIPNNYENEFWSEGKTHRGILRLILHWSQNSEGIYNPMLEAERVGAYFYKGKKISDVGNNVLVKLTNKPNIASIFEQSPNLLIALTVRYECSIL